MYYRLNVFPLFIPPLRERSSDVLLLAEHFLNKYARENEREITTISPSVIDLLTTYSWPGNVRELENCMERAVLVCNSTVLQINHLPPSLQWKEGEAAQRQEESLDFLVKKYEKDILLNSLSKTMGNQRQAAKDLGTTQRILGYKLKLYGINPLDFKLD